MNFITGTPECLLDMAESIWHVAQSGGELEPHVRYGNDFSLARVWYRHLYLQFLHSQLGGFDLYQPVSLLNHVPYVRYSTHL